MKTRNILSIAVAGFLAATPFAAHAQDPAQLDQSLPDTQVDTVYLMTNQVSNSIAVYNLIINGDLRPVGTFPTGGNGDPKPQPGDTRFDPLASQGSLILSEDTNFLFSVNAGSNEISVLLVKGDTLLPVSKVASGGIRPISLTKHDDLLYVLNEGNPPNITGFKWDGRGQLFALPGGTRLLDGDAKVDPAQVGFSPDGALLVVTQKASGTISTYTVGKDGLAKGPISNKSNGFTPFGFAFVNDSTVVVTEAFFGAAQRSAVTSYHLLGDKLGVVSASIPNSQTASCWIAISGDDQYAFTSNTGSGTISSYRVLSDGRVSLMNSVAADNGLGTSPIDLATVGHHLYIHLAGIQKIGVFRIESDGELNGITAAGDLPVGAQGIAAKERR